VTIVVMDAPTASALAQILPLLLLTLILELRRTALHRKVSRNPFRCILRGVRCDRNGAGAVDRR
jgi:hypothetical protein